MAAKHLLLIDDNEDNRTLVKFALETSPDWKVLTATDGIEGISKAEAERPDVILLDFIMPGLDGLTVCEVLKSNLFTSGIPVIFMTAWVQDKALTQLENSLAEGVITKPFDVIHLDSQIAKICQWESSDASEYIQPNTSINKTLLAYEANKVWIFLHCSYLLN